MGYELSGDSASGVTLFEFFLSLSSFTIGGSFPLNLDAAYAI